MLSNAMLMSAQYLWSGTVSQEAEADLEAGGWEVLPGEELTIHWLWLWCYHCSAFPRGVLTAHLRRAPVPPGQRATIGSAPGRTTSAWKSSIRRFVITEKVPTRAFSWLEAATTAFTFKTLLRHYAKWALTPRSLNVKLGPRRNYHKGRAAIRHYANQPGLPFMTFASVSRFHFYLQLTIC